jgi:membrane-associated phospholipid phosphatase
MVHSDSRRTDTVMVSYLLSTALLVVVFHQKVPQWPTLIVIHLIATVAIGALRFLPAGAPAVVRFLRDWYPVIAFPVLYKEVELLAAAFGNWGLTEPIRSLEVFLFAGHPSDYSSEILEWAPLSEYLHLCYFAHVLLLPALGGYWYHTKREAFYELIFLVSVVLATSYLFFILFPVDSPFYLADPLPESLRGHFFYDLVHYVADRGGARGGAFPSTHVSVSTTIWLLAWHRERRIACWLLLLVPGLIFATVYGRFHYVLDVITGWAHAGIVFVWGTRLEATKQSLETEEPQPSQL